MLENVPIELIKKYATSGPRYTSYPTALELHSNFDPQHYQEALQTHSAQEPISLYVHIPFCPQLCYFCACNKVITKREDIIERYLATLVKEIQAYKTFPLSSAPVTQLHFGGGSPSYISTGQFARIMDALHSTFANFRSEAEISIEVDPRTVNRDKLAFYRSQGFNRISFGAQDFDPCVQETINRVQPYEMTAQTLHDATALGFSGTNIDLIYGLPNQTPDSFNKTISLLNELRPDRIALYGYAHVPWVKKVQKVLEKAHLPAPQERLDLFVSALRALTEAGYVHIGMDHFALPEDELALAINRGTLFRNFMGYTVRKSDVMLGFGSSSISSLPDMLVQNHKELDAYNGAIESGSSVIERGCIRSREDQLRADIIQHLFCQMRLDIPALEQQWQFEFWKHFSELRSGLQPFVDDGIIQVSEATLQVATLGKLFIRNVAMLFDAYLAKHRASEKPVFSQAV